ncbi:hypothetical protein R1flu_016250 [Riccia fluitans]|uniref:Fatty acid desaturase domain-containing protein n=1 Tax=Riccia fluitans TaxID=41844 RepID=A0ABD1YLD0_9MARC
MRGDWFALIAAPLFFWILGVNTFHDAAHFSLHKNWKVNRFVPYLFPILTSPLAWYHQHNIGHHSYTNVSHRDPELAHFTFWKREHKSVKWRPAHEKQRSPWFLLFWWTVAVEIAFATMNDLWMIKDKVYNECVPMKALSRRRLLCHCLGRVIGAGFLFVWPFFFFDTWTRVIIFAVVPYVIVSNLFMVNTQINHLTTDTAHAGDEDWFKHQVVTAQDFGVKSKFCFFLSGGLNLQVTHHLFPTVNHCHLHKLQPIVALLCDKYSVKYKTYSGYFDAIRAHHDHVVRMSYNDDEH